MNLNALANQVELQIVNNEHGWSVDISYTYRENQVNIPAIKAFFQEGYLGKKADEGSFSVERDEAIFFSVDLPSRPIKGDKIETSDGEFWYVDYLTGTSPYDIYCLKNITHAKGRTGRRDR